MTERGDDGYNISASQVKAHSKCSQQWQFRYRSDKEPAEGEMKYLYMGSRVHESIEEALMDENRPALDHREALKAAFQNIYREKDEYPLEDDMYDTGIECLEKAAKYIVKRGLEITDIEKRVEYEIDRNDLSTGVTAIMDIVAEDEIWDWKTGKVRDDISHDEQIQGATYMAAFYNEYGRPPEAIRFIYVKEEKVRSLDPDDEIWEYMMKHAEKLVRDKENDDFSPDPGSHCYWCDYEMFCPGSEVGVGGVPFDEY